MHGFGVTEFQLVLLRRMADFRPEAVEEALRRLGVGRAAMREANRRWQAMVRAAGFPKGVGRYAAVLGPPEDGWQRQLGDLRCSVRQWRVPLWPELRFEVLAGPADTLLNEWLVRAPGVAAPVLRSAADLLPWSCVVADVATAFPPARPREGSAPTRFELDFAAPDLSGTVLPWTADFTWGLLQEVRPGRV